MTSLQYGHASTTEGEKEKIERIHGETHLTNTNEYFRNVSVERIGEIISMSNYVVDKVCLACKALEKEIALGCIVVILRVYLG